jgi:L-fuconolactonase
MVVNDTLLDAHVHLLQADIEYPWMTDDATRSLLSRQLPELEGEFSSHHVAGGVVIQATSDKNETARLLKLAQSNPAIVGVVGWIDLASPSIEYDLDAVLHSSGGEWLVGLRHQVHDEVDPAWLMRPDVVHGLEHVAAVGLPFDLLVRPREMASAIALATEIPTLSLILDHLAKPVVNSSRAEEWKSDLVLLARHSNTYCKLSGIVTEAAPLGKWTADLLQPYLSSALDAFGPERCVFGSDWPVCRLAATYSQVVELATGALESLSEEQREDVLFRNAARIYKLVIPIADSAVSV